MAKKKAKAKNKVGARVKGAGAAHKHKESMTCKHCLLTAAMCVLGVITIAYVAVAPPTQTTPIKGLIMPPLEKIPATSGAPSVSIGIATDKGLYHSKEQMAIDFTITSDSDVENAQFHVYGLQKSGRYKLDQTKLVNLTTGENKQNLVYGLPSCNTCSGLRAGTYYVGAELVLEGETLASANVSIELQQ